MPRISKDVSTEELQVGQRQEFNIPNTGSIDREDFRDDIQLVDTPVESTQTQELLFMEEKLLVEIPKGSDPKNESEFVEVYNNGVAQFFMRGTPQLVKRKFVEVLARAKREVIETPKVKDANGDPTYNITKTPSLMHHFIVHDDTPKGRAWLRGILAEA